MNKQNEWSKYSNPVSKSIRINHWLFRAGYSTYYRTKKKREFQSANMENNTMTQSASEFLESLRNSITVRCVDDEVNTDRWVAVEPNYEPIY